MKIFITTLLIVAALCILVGLILFNKKRIQEKDFRGITWSNMQKQTDIIKKLNGGVGEAHIDEEYSQKMFKELDMKDQVVSVLSVAAMMLVISAAIFFLLAGDMGYL